MCDQGRKKDKKKEDVGLKEVTEAFRDLWTLLIMLILLVVTGQEATFKKPKQVHDVS